MGGATPTTMNACGYFGKEQDETAAQCRECGTDLSEPPAETLATAATRWTFGQMLIAAVAAFLITLFIPSGLILLVADSSRFASFHDPDFAVRQKTAAGVFVALGVTAGFVGYWMAARLRRTPLARSKRRSLAFLFAGLVFLGAIGFGVIGAPFLVYCFCGVP